MTGTTITITDMLNELDASGELAAERDRRQSEHHKAALDRTEAHSAAIQDQKAVRRRVNNFMRELSNEVADARQAAIDALGRGEGALDAWISYRLKASGIRGRWHALRGEYQRQLGHEPPAGPHLPELHAEPFEKFLTAAMSKAQRDAFEQAERATRNELNTRRDKRQAQADADERAPE